MNRQERREFRQEQDRKEFLRICEKIVFVAENHQWEKLYQEEIGKRKKEKEKEEKEKETK